MMLSVQCVVPRNYLSKRMDRLRANNTYVWILRQIAGTFFVYLSLCFFNFWSISIILHNLLYLCFFIFWSISMFLHNLLCKHCFLCLYISLSLVFLCFPCLNLSSVSLFFLNWANPGLFFVYFRSFQTNIITISTTD